jgi:hypothetical protein
MLIPFSFASFKIFSKINSTPPIIIYR